MKNRRCAEWAVLLTAAMVSVCWAEPRVRPLEWAQPVIGNPLNNWHKLDDKVHRSEQPNKDDFEQMEAFGIRAVLNLRRYHSDDEAEGTKLALFRLKTNAGDMSYQELVDALRIFQAAEGPILVHCWHGSDRTGAVCAAWRIARHGWTPAEAVDEMKSGGFGFHETLYGSLAEMVLAIDPAQLRRDAGIEQLDLGGE